MEKILITGAAGFIGKNLVKNSLKEKKDYLILLDKNSLVSKLFPDFKTIIADIRNKKLLEDLFLKEKPKIVIHLAAVIKSKNKEEFESVNVEGTRRLIHLSEFFNVKKFIFISSDFVLYNPSDFYGQSKKKCEEILQNSKIDFTIFRPTPVFGPGDNKNFATLISVIKKYPVLPAIKCLMEPVYVGDLIKAIIASLNHSFSRRIYNLPGGSIHQFPEILKIISRALKLKRIIITLPPSLFLPVARIYEKIFPNPLLNSYQIEKWLKTKPLDVSLAKNELKYSPISFEEGFKLLLKYENKFPTFSLL